MGALHELLAAEEDARGQANKIAIEAEKTFKDKHAHFESEVIVFTPNTEEGGDAVTEKDTAMVTTVRNKLDYVSKSFVKFMDALYQKESTNAKAVADIVLSDGTKLAEGVPATALLNFERELNKLFGIYNVIPTLDPGVKWTHAGDDGAGLMKRSEIKNRTKKDTIFKSVAKATEHHPEQVVQISKDIVTGTIETTKYSSKITPAAKSVILERLNDLKTSVKKARMRANKTEVETNKICKKLFTYINTGEVK